MNDFPCTTSIVIKCYGHYDLLSIVLSTNEVTHSYEGSYAPKSYFKFCFEDPVYFIHLMEQNLGNQNRN